MKYLSIIAGLALALTANAQRAGVWSMVGDTNVVAAASTNTITLTPQPAQPSGIQNAGPILSIAEFDTIGITITASPAASVSGTVNFKFSLCYDGGQTLFEALPSITLPMVFSGTNAGWAGGVFSVPGASHLALVKEENATSVAVTNIVVRVFLKSPKRGALRATQ